MAHVRQQPSPTWGKGGVDPNDARKGYEKGTTGAGKGKGKGKEGKGHVERPGGNQRELAAFSLPTPNVALPYLIYNDVDFCLQSK